MRRDTFLKRVGLVIGGVALGRHVPAEVLTPEITEAAILADSPVAYYPMGLVASGGLCAPLSPIYDMPSFAARPIREALPTFTASRGMSSPE